MRNKIDYGIYLGLGHACMCRMEKGVPVIKKIDVTDDTMPCCVFFNRRGGIVVGASAYRSLKSDKIYATKSWHSTGTNAFVEFQRAMGTDKVYHSKNMEDKGLKADYTSEELSAEVLKALKSYITDESFRSVVITVPAKFSVSQINATKEAAKLAGFDHCELLQEPIAASLAYGISSIQNNGYWMVFDFDDCTFNVALIKAQNGAIQVVDTDGDNYLGGNNLDYAIVDEIIIPYLKECYGVKSILLDEDRKEVLRDAMKSYAEDLRNKLSFQEKEDIISNPGELGEDEEGEEIELDLSVTQDQVFAALKPLFQKAIDICKNLLERNAIKGNQLDKIILVGSPTRSPLIREMLSEQVNHTIDISIDPATCKAIGATLYASTIDTNIEHSKRETTVDCPTNENRTAQKPIVEVASLPYHLCTDEFNDIYLRVETVPINGLEKGVELPASGKITPLKIEVEVGPNDEEIAKIPLFKVDSLYVGQYAFLCEKVADILIIGECLDFVIPKEATIGITIFVNPAEEITVKGFVPELGRSFNPIVIYNQEKPDSEYHGQIKYEIRYGYDKLNKMLKDGMDVELLYSELKSVDCDFENIPTSEKEHTILKIKAVLRKIDKLDNETILERRKNNLIKGITIARSLREQLYKKVSQISLLTIERDAKEALGKDDPKLIRKVLSQVEGYIFTQKDRIKKDEALKNDSVLLNVSLVENYELRKAYASINIDKDSDYDKLNIQICRKESRINPRGWTSELKEINKTGGILELEIASTYWNEYEIIAYTSSGSQISVYPSTIIIDKINYLNNYSYGKNQN